MLSSVWCRLCIYSIGVFTAYPVVAWWFVYVGYVKRYIFAL